MTQSAPEADWDAFKHYGHKENPAVSTTLCMSIEIWDIIIYILW